MKFSYSTVNTPFRLCVALLLSVIFTIAGIYGYLETKTRLLDNTIANHQHSVEVLARGLETSFDQQLQESRVLVSVLRNQYLVGGRFTNQTVDINGRKLPEVWLDDHELSDNATVDKFAQDTGRKATIFVVDRGELVSLASSLLSPDGKRYVGQSFSSDINAYQALLRGEEYYLKQRLYGRDYLHYLAPVLDMNGQLVATMVVSTDLEEVLQALFASLGEFSWGKTGYSIVFDASGDARGNYLYHPLTEEIGQNVIARANAEKPFQKLFESDRGIIFYPHEYLGKSAQKYLAFSYVDGWDWVFAGGTFVDEVNHDIRHILTLLLAITAVVGLVALALLRALLRGLLTPLTQQEQPQDTALDYGDGKVLPQLDSATGSPVAIGLNMLHSSCDLINQICTQGRSGARKLEQQHRQSALELEQLLLRVDHLTPVVYELVAGMDAIEAASKQQPNDAIMLLPELAETQQQLARCYGSMELIEQHFNDTERLIQDNEQMAALIHTRGGDIIELIRTQHHRMADAISRLDAAAEASSQ